MTFKLTIRLLQHWRGRDTWQWSAVWPLLGSSNNVYRPQLSPVSSRCCSTAATVTTPAAHLAWALPGYEGGDPILSIYIINSQLKLFKVIFVNDDALIQHNY